ncbi:MAG: multicopper oxidase domain-containing protein [Desulfosarcinaceae bacterium]|nr:multicopper oxidase domain-containing protein [Desulfosarcinaceae bacterium]
MAIMQPLRQRLPLIILLFTATWPLSAGAQLVNYELSIAEERVAIGGKVSQGMTINGSIPGPTLRFTEGDTARIVVHNRMRVPTSIHWHGLLLAPEMDGVPRISFPGIAPGTSFTYEFPIRQSGTYWYHSHSNMQEQRGVYGSIVIEPRQQAPAATVDREHVILFSDWTTEDPHAVLRSLKMGSEWYAIEKGSGQSLVGAARMGKLGDYLRRELQRMPAMDIADVAYDHFLANGQPDADLPAVGGETLRLRVVNGSATTYFHLEFAGSPMTIVAADGIDVEPVEQQRLLIAVAETYDLLVKMPVDGAYELRATAHDGSGYASVWLGSGQRHRAPELPKPNLYHGMHHGGGATLFALTPPGTMGMSDRDVAAGRFDRPGMAGMDHTEMAHGHDMAHEEHDHAAMQGMQPHDSMPGHSPPTETGMAAKPSLHQPLPAPQMSGHGTPHGAHAAAAADLPARSGRRYATNFRPLASDVSSMAAVAVDGADPRRPWPPYTQLRARQATAFDPDKPVREFRFTLDGDMHRYVWLLNNKPLSESDVIHMRAGEVIRFIMINRTMMHHPMHLHGHFFRVLNGQGDHAPLKHTVDVAPMSTTVIEFYGDEFGDWFFHCHLLYHMKSGMARVIHYEGYQAEPETAALRPDLFKSSWYAWAEADLLSNMTEGEVVVADTRNSFKAAWEAGWQQVDATEWEGLVSYERWVNRFFSLLGGIDVLGEGEHTDETRGVLGVHYLLPLNVESTAWVDSELGARFMLEKEVTLTPRLSLVGELEYDTHELWEGKAGLAYAVTKQLSLRGQWHAEFGWGGGLQFRF